MPRQAITAAKLHALLTRDYADARVVDCVTGCPMPKPVFRESVDGSANWHVPPAIHCPRHCNRIIADIAAKLAAEYDLDAA